MELNLNKILKKANSYDKVIFIDEAGNENITKLGTDGVTDFYVVGALICDSADVRNLENDFGEVRKNFFKKEMKSSYVKGKITRRKKVLESIFAVPNFSVYILIVKKKGLEGGYKYPDSFIKNIQLKLYHSFKSKMCDILIISDNIKMPNFNQKFKRYITKNVESSLWARKDLGTVDSKSCNCIQAIDFIAGSVLRSFEFPSEYESISEAIPKNIVSFSYFPEKHQLQFLFPMEIEEYNPEIADEAFAIADNYTREKINSVEEKYIIRVQFLERLKAEFICGKKHSWILLDEIAEWLYAKCNLDKSKDSIRYHIGKLKEDGILIASRTEGGYKLPCCITDLERFVENMGSKIVPMLDRMKKARDIVRKSLVSNYDIIDDKPIYKELIEAYEKVQADEILFNDDC